MIILKPLQITIVLVLVFVSGLVSGLYSKHDVEAPEAKTVAPVPPQPAPAGNPFVDISEAQYRQRLEAEVRQLRERVATLEQELAAQQHTEELLLDDGQAKDAGGDKPEEQSAEKLTLENLVKAGVAEALAEDIINRINRYEFELLALHDRARREGYLNSARYFKERRQLTDSRPSLREAIGDEAYDHYLYQTAQNNRVMVTTVIMGTSAQQMGVQQGDVILSYDGKTIITWQDLRELSGRDTYGEYVNLAVLRDGQVVNILIPRGPLGVKLGKTVVDPGVGDGY